MTAILDTIFDTLVDTHKIYVSMKTKFILRKYDNDKPLPVYLHITGNGRERIHLDIYVDSKKWNLKTQRLNNPTQLEKDTNLVLDNIQAKITNIKTVYRLSEKVLTPKLLAKELKEGLPRVNFISFFKIQLAEDKPFLKKGTYRRYQSVLEKLKNYNSYIYFTDITNSFITHYKKHLVTIGNKSTTVNSNIRVIKKYLGAALKYGIKIPIDLDEIRIGSTNGNRTSLLPNDLRKIDKFYFSEFISNEHKLILGYFLFSCMTGLRISDIQSLERSQITDDVITFTSVKTNKDQMISLNKKAIDILNHEILLFEKKLTNEYMNRELKNIFSFLKIKKKITFHVARHTFATNFLRMGGNVEKLQILLGHSDIKQTMIYVHIVAEEANKEVYLLDKLF